MVHQKSAPVSSQALITEGERHPIFVEDRFTVYAEFKDGCMFLHCSPISQWGRNTYIACLEAMNIIKSSAAKHGYDAVYVYIPLHKLKFVSSLGFGVIETYKDLSTGDPYLLCGQETN